MKGRFQPTTVGNMARDPNGGYVCAEDYDAMAAKHAALEVEYQKQREAAAAMISNRDGTINGMRAVLESWATYARTYRTATHAQWDDCVRKTVDVLKTQNVELRGASDDATTK